MLSDLFKKNAITKNINQAISVDDFLEDDIKIEIEKNNQSQPNRALESQNINPEGLMRDYESIKILSINPQVKKKVIDLVAESKEDLQKFHRILSNL
jgi:hypothetical protein